MSWAVEQEGQGIQNIPSNDVPFLVDQRIDVSSGVLEVYAYYNTDKFGFYGEDLMTRCMAFRSFLDAGIPAAAGSDFSPGPFAPLMGIQGMVTRTGWNGEIWGANQRVTVDEALRINTLNGAYASGEESIKGSITAGKLADFVVLADDLHTVNNEKTDDRADTDDRATPTTEGAKGESG